MGEGIHKKLRGKKWNKGANAATMQLVECLSHSGESRLNHITVKNAHGFLRRHKALKYAAAF